MDYQFSYPTATPSQEASYMCIIQHFTFGPKFSTILLLESSIKEINIYNYFKLNWNIALDLLGESNDLFAKIVAQTRFA